jgi:Lamin Tail Domain
VFAVWTPNDATVQGRTWQSYQTTVACVEQRTGLDFFAAVDDAVETVIEGVGCLKKTYLPLVANNTVPLPPASINIAWIEYDPSGDDLAGEFVLLQNTGGSEADLTGWTLADAAGNTYTFPAFSLAASAEVRVWVRTGANDAGNLYWSRAQPVWNNSGGDTAYLRDTGGNLLVQYHYES